MHAIFIPYGIKQAVEHTLADMAAQKFEWLFQKEGEPDKKIWLQGSIRIMPFGVIEYVFPKEAANLVLTSLDFDKPNRYQDRGLIKLPIAMIRKVLGCKKASKFDNSKKLLWIRNDVNFIPIGIREDGYQLTTEKDEMGAGWKHEAL